MVLGKFTPVNNLDPIRFIRWKKRCIGIATYKLKLHNQVEILETGKDGKRYCPDVYYINGEEARKKMRSGEYEKDVQKGVQLVMIPINDLEPLERE